MRYPALRCLVGVARVAIMTRASLRAVARGLVGALLMAQLAIAAYACPALAAGLTATMQMPAPSVLDDAAPPDASMPMAHAGNCDDMVGTMDASSPNLCAEYCKYGQQSDRATSLYLPAVVLTVLYATPPAHEPGAPPRTAAATLSALAACVPHTVLHCVYRL